MDEQLSAARAGLAGLAVLPIGYKKELVHDDKIALALFYFLGNRKFTFFYKLSRSSISLQIWKNLSYYRQTEVAPAMVGNSRLGMNRNGGVGVFVRRHYLTDFSSMACAAELDSFLHPLSHIPPPRFGYFCAKSNKKKFL